MAKMERKIVALLAKLNAAPGLKTRLNRRRSPITLIDPSDRNLIANSLLA